MLPSGITLHEKIEEALDKGQIAVIPVPPKDGNEIITWKCVLVDQSHGDDLIDSFDGKAVTLMVGFLL